MKLGRKINIGLWAVAVIAIAVAVIVVWPRGGEAVSSRKHTLDAARVKSIREMARLSTLEIYEETGVRDTINGKGLFAILRLEGHIGYDVDKLQIDSIGVDSLRVTLPREIVELRESTDSGSYRVVDVWNVAHPLLGANLTATEENELKRRAASRISKLAYQRGYVKRARENAIATLSRMYGALPDVYVEVVAEE